MVTIPFSYWPGGSVDVLTGLYFKSVALFWLIGNTITSVARFRQFAWGLTLMSVPIAATAVKNYLSGNVWWAQIALRDTTRPSPTTRTISPSR